VVKTNSKKSLVIVESPAKAKTINKYLGSGFEVKSSMGHVRDLPSKGLNVDIENGFEPTYKVIPTRKKTIADLKAAAKNCDTKADGCNLNIVKQAQETNINYALCCSYTYGGQTAAVVLKRPE